MLNIYEVECVIQLYYYHKCYVDTDEGIFNCNYELKVS